MKAFWRRGWGAGLGLVGCFLASVPALAADVTVSFVTEQDGHALPLQPIQALWRSPFGGWVTITWPFGLKVDDRPIMEYKSSFDKLLDQAGLEPGAPADSRLSDMAGELLGEKKVEASDLLTFTFDRSSTARVDLPPGEHAITPGDLRFTVKADGSLETADKRLRVIRDGNRLEVLCHPVTVRAMSGARSVPFAIQLTCGQQDLLGGLTGPIQEFEDKVKAGTSSSEAQGFRRVTLYVPASDPGNAYAVSGSAFEVDLAGQVKTSDEKKLHAAGNRELHLLIPASGPSDLRAVGIRWFGSGKGIQVSSTDGPFSSLAVAGSTSIRVPATGKPVVSFGPAPGPVTVTVAIPTTFNAWPFKVLLFDAAGSACWLAESARLTVRPGGEYACRISALTGKAPALKGDLPVQLQSRSGAGAVHEFTLTAKGDSMFTGVLPSAVEPGVWSVMGGRGSPLAGQPLGLVLVSGAAPPGALSFYTYRNRGLFRQGDPINLFWTLKGKAGVTGIPIRLKGQALEYEIGRIKTMPAADGKPVSGHLQLDTAALAPGLYEVSGGGDGLACYAGRFRICQREAVSDFETYSYVFGTVKPSGGLPLTAYYDCRLAAEPGLQPLMAGVRGGLDPAFAAYTTAPEGPATELCEPLPDDEAVMMALAGMGSKAVPAMPRVLHHEDWNPKHSLPEELARMRRRLALFTQQYADVSGFDGVALNWYATLNGYWEESKPLDGHQAVRNAAAAKWIADRTAARVEEEKKKDPDAGRLENVKRQAQFEFTSMVLPNAYGDYLRDAIAIRPDLTSHSGIPSFWLGGGSSYPPLAYATLSHRDSVDYTDYGISPWGNFRAPAFLDMGNANRQKTRCCFMTYGRHSRFITAFGAAGRGLDGISLNPEDPYSRGEDEALLRIFQRFGSYFTSLDPLPDVAVYFSALHPWPQQKSVVLHDLARLRRPGMLVSQEDVLAGRLAGCKVLFIAGLGEGEPKAVLDAFGQFESKGGVILKDKTCAASVPGKDLGFAYDKDQVHDGWGLAWPNGEWEFAHLWTNYQQTREKPLLQAFAAVPAIPVGTSDREVLISPLAGKESICCFVMNATYVPMSVPGSWRQHAALPRRADLIVQEGWHVRDLLSGKACKLERAAGGNRVAMDFTRAEGAIYLLTKREPTAATVKTERTGPTSLRLTAWLTAGGDQAIADPMPFEVTLEGADKTTYYRKFASLGPDKPMEVPVPALDKGAALTLVVRDLVLGSVTSQPVDPARTSRVTAEVEDVVGRDSIRDFLTKRKGSITILLDERQQDYRAAAGTMATLLKQAGRDARVMVYDPAEVRLLPLRWKWQEEDLRILDGVRKGSGIAWRVNLPPRRDLPKATFDDPTTGFAEYGPRTWFDGDVVLFGTPDNSLALEDLRPFLRRPASRDYPSAGGFFAQYLWDPFSGGYDGVYLGCRDTAGAEAAVAFLADLAGGMAVKAKLPAPETAPPVVTRSKDTAPLPDMIAGNVGTRVLDVAYAPGGNRIFVTADSYGDSLFVLNPAGEIVDKRPIQNRCGNELWWRGGGVLAPVSDTQLRIRVGDSDYLLDVEKGFQARSVNPPHGLAGRFQVKIGGPTILKDPARGRTYLGGARRLRALDKTGAVAWTYDDADARTSTDDLLYPRSIFIRAVSPDGRHLLASAFGIEQDCYGIGSVRNPSLFCLDTTSGKVAWTQDGLLLNEGKVVPMEGRFLVVDDGGRLHLFGADNGREQGSLRSVGGADWILPVPRKEVLLVVENNRFDENGPTALVYVRPLGAEPDVPLKIVGRVTDVAIAPDGRKVVLATDRGEAACFSMVGERLWTAKVPCGGVVRFSPDNKTVLVGTREGRLVFVDMENGKLGRQVDFNPFNLTSGEQFVKQMNSIGSVPQEKDAAVPPEAPAASYRASLNQEAVTFGGNLVPMEAVLATLKKGAMPAGDPAKPGYVAVLDKPAEFRLKVEAGRTYLVEMLTGVADAGSLTPQTRLEVSVTAAKSANLPCVARLPIGERLTRRRMAFRTDEQTEVTVSLRVIKPGIEGEGKTAKPTYAKAEPGDVPVLVGDVVVAAMNFAGANLVLDKGPAARTAPVGNLECEVKPWTGGNSTIRWQPYPAPQQALRLTDGIIANQETVWTTAVKGPEIAWAEGLVRFKKPQTISAIAVYDDPSGPIPAGQGVQEKAAMHYGVYVHSPKSGQWTRVGYAADNTDLVNVFTFPAADVDQVRYFWAGRNHAGMTDGVVRSAEIEVYSSEDSALLLDNGKSDGGDEDLNINL